MRYFLANLFTVHLLFLLSCTTPSPQELFETCSSYCQQHPNAGMCIGCIPPPSPLQQCLNQLTSSSSFSSIVSCFQQNIPKTDLASALTAVNCVTVATSVSEIDTCIQNSTLCTQASSGKQCTNSTVPTDGSNWSCPSYFAAVLNVAPIMSCSIAEVGAVQLGLGTAQDAELAQGSINACNTYCGSSAKAAATSTCQSYNCSTHPLSTQCQQYCGSKSTLIAACMNSINAVANGQPSAPNCCSNEAQVQATIPGFLMYCYNIASNPSITTTSAYSSCLQLYANPNSPFTDAVNNDSASSFPVCGAITQCGVGPAGDNSEANGTCSYDNPPTLWQMMEAVCGNSEMINTQECGFCN